MTDINIIDCNHLAEENENEIAEEINESNENDDDDDSNEDNQLNLNEEDEENLTVIMPEQINNIFVTSAPNSDDKKHQEPQVDFIFKKTRYLLKSVLFGLKKKNNHFLYFFKVNVNEKFKEINSKIPNYFLAQDDLESKMKKLHYKYVQVIE